MEKIREADGGRCAACGLRFLSGELYQVRGPKHFRCPTTSGVRGMFRVLRDVWRP